MNETLVRLYHRMPPSVRSLAATARGLQLRRFRYSRQTTQLVAEALDRDRWPATRWQAWRDGRLAFILHRAATRVPYYREMWADRRRHGDHSSWERLENWPILEKDVLRQYPRAFLADDCDPRDMMCESTSGTSGKPLHLWLSRDTTRAWYALFEARCRVWNGLTRDHPWAILGGQLVAPVTQARPPFWVWNGALKQLYMSVYHLSPDFAPAYLDALVQHGIDYLLGYTSALEALADSILRSGRTDYRPRVVLTNAEPLYALQREKLEDAFRCPVRETYGMSETAAAASECSEGALHLWPEAGQLEVIDGDLISTALVNPDMPLIRYRVGDRVILAPEHETCRCGRTLPILRSVEGRSDDVLYTRDGRRIGRLDPIFKSRLPLQEAQIVQESLDRIRVLYVPDSAFTPKAAADLTRLIRERMGDVHVELERVDRVPRGANGKFRAVLCKLSKEERELAHAQ